MIGVYKIISPSGRVYIGESINIERRFKNYKHKFKKDKSQPKLYRSFNKYGIENHTFEIIEECLFEDLLCRERYWQDFYDALNTGLNCKLTICGDLKTVYTEYTKNKISLSQIGNKNSMYGVPAWNKGLTKDVLDYSYLRVPKKNKTNVLNKEVYQVDMQGNIVKLWESMKEAERVTGIFQANISKVCLGERKSAGGFKWEYK